MKDDPVGCNYEREAAKTAESFEGGSTRTPYAFGAMSSGSGGLILSLPQPSSLPYSVFQMRAHDLRSLSPLWALLRLRIHWH